jgi:hypothetical protein
VDSAGKNFSGNKFRKELFAISKNKDRVAVIDQYTAVLEAECKKVVRRTTALKAKKAKKEPDTSSSEDSDDASIHVMDTQEVQNARTEYVKNRLRANFERLKKRRVSYTTGTSLRTGRESTGTDSAGTGDEDQLDSKEAAFNEQVNRPEQDDTVPM